MKKSLTLFVFITSILCCINIQALEGLGFSKSHNEVYINSGETTLFCRTMGQGKPLIVLHGGPGLTQDYLLPEMTKLSENHFVIFYDQRGCGQSTGELNSDSINIKNFVNDLDAIRKHFGFEKISILGHSWGGFLAIKYAIAHPESVDKLILSNSIPASSEELCLFFDEWQRRMAPYQDEMRRIQATKEFAEGEPNTVENYHRIILRTYCYLPEKADLLNLEITPKAFLSGAKVYKILHENLLSKPFNLHESLKTLDVHTLVIHGDTDPIPAYTAKYLHESLPNSEYVLMRNCGHFPYVEDSTAYFRHLKEFLNL